MNTPPLFSFTWEYVRKVFEEEQVLLGRELRITILPSEDTWVPYLAEMMGRCDLENFALGPGEGIDWVRSAATARTLLQGDAALGLVQPNRTTRSSAAWLRRAAPQAARGVGTLEKPWDGFGTWSRHAGRVRILRPFRGLSLAQLTKLMDYGNYFLIMLVIMAITFAGIVLGDSVWTPELVEAMVVKNRAPLHPQTRMLWERSVHRGMVQQGKERENCRRQRRVASRHMWALPQSLEESSN